MRPMIQLPYGRSRRPALLMDGMRHRPNEGDLAQEARIVCTNLAVTTQRLSRP
jgi:hypothetical protein